MLQTTSPSSVLKIVKPSAVRLVLDRVGGGRGAGGRGYITKFSIRGGSAPLSYPLSVYIPKIPLSTFY